MLKWYYNVDATRTAVGLHEDKSSDIEQQPPFGDRKYSNTLPQKSVGVMSTKYEAVHPTHLSENNSSSGMLIMLTKN